MINAKFDSRQLNKMLNNTVKYSQGFFDGIDISREEFNRQLGFFIKEALKKYIDAKARSNPNAFHHIYEWEMVGSPRGRLFDFDISYTKYIIKFSGSFISSKVPSPNSDNIFSDKANIMENQISVTVEPKDSDILVFEDNGETIFTKNPITIENPGGEAVAGSFVQVVDEFFNNYLTVGLLKSSGILDKLSNPKQYSQRFAQGVKSGRPQGIIAGKEYLNIGGIDI